MKLTKLQFDILTSLLEAEKSESLNDIIGKISGADRAEICSEAAKLEKDGFIDGMTVTEKGIEALEPLPCKAHYLPCGGLRLSPCSDYLQHAQAARPRKRH